MDYEKAYTNAVARAKQAIKDCGHNEGRKRMIEDIFPELADPDRIRQEILEYISKATGCEKWIAWLEKQGERKEQQLIDKAVEWLTLNFEEDGKSLRTVYKTKGEMLSEFVNDMSR